MGKIYIQAFVPEVHTDESAPKPSEIKKAPLKVKCVYLPAQNKQKPVNQSSLAVVSTE